MSERRFTIEEKLKMTLGAFRDMYEQSNQAFWSTNDEKNPVYWQSLGEESAWKAAVKRIETLLAELPDTQTDHDRYIEARAEANVYKSQLLELGSIIASQAKDGSERSLKILTPYIVLAMNNRPRQ